MRDPLTKTIRLSVLTIALSFLCVGLVFAQEKTVSGTVTDGATGGALPGANVSVKGAQTGTTTDAQGQYELTVPGPNVTLVFSFIGYQTKEVEVGDKTTINVTLQEKVGKLEEVVVTGYSQQQRQEITGSVSSVDVAEATIGQNTSTQELLKGRISGLQVLDNSGEPGSGVSLRIRGTTSISAGSDPLYVIDGVPISNTSVTPGGPNAGGVSASNSTNPLALLSPQDIKNIQVLKDAAGTAIYGSQGANGVVLIETKQGTGGTAQVDYSGSASIGTPANTLDLLDAETYRAQTGGSGDVSTDWQDEMLRNAVTQEHSLSFSGGTNKTSYRASLGYLNNQGVILNNAIERVTGRINAQHKVLDDRLRFNLNLTASHLNRRHVFYSQASGFQSGVIGSMIAFLPTVPVKTGDGQFAEFSDNFRNPVALQERITDITDQNRILGNFSTEFDLLESLTLKGTVGLDKQSAVRRGYIPGSGPPKWIGRTNTNGGLAQQSRNSLSNFVTQVTITYDQEVMSGQQLRVLGGFERKQEIWQELGASSESFSSDALLFNRLGAGGDPNPPSSLKERVRQVSFFGRVNYNIDGKYLLEATLRRDGSSVFGENEKFALFPAVSAGWNVAQEDFLDVEDLTQLKFRFSWGISGNQAVPPYETLASLEAGGGNSTPFGPGVAQERAPNPDLKWEETQEFNLGLDFTYGLFDGSINAYRKKTSDLLLNVPAQQPSTSEFRLGNVGNVLNRGIEFNLSTAVIQKEDISLDLGGNISSNYNEITDLGSREFIDHTQVSGPGQTGVQAQRLDEGFPIGAFYGPKFVGTNDKGEELYECDSALDGCDGGTTTSSTVATKQYIGNPIPDFTYGLNASFRYKNFDASAFFRGEQGSKLFNNTALEFQYESKVGTSNILASALNDGVGPDGADNTNKTTVTPTYSSRWIQNASYLRLASLTIGYRLPVDQLGLRRARIYASGENLLTFTPYDGYDPEVNTNVTGKGIGFRTLARPTRGVDYTSYPRPRTFTLGIQIGL